MLLVLVSGPPPLGDLLLVNHLPAIHLLVWIHPLANQQPHILSLKLVELLAEVDEALQSCLLDVLCECGQT